MPRPKGFINARHKNLVKYLQQRGIELTPEQARIAETLCKVIEQLPARGGKTTLLKALAESDVKLYPAGHVVWLKEFDNGDEVIPREQAEVIEDNGDTLIVGVEPTDPRDDGIREVTRDQIEEGS